MEVTELRTAEIVPENWLDYGILYRDNTPACPLCHGHPVYQVTGEPYPNNLVQVHCPECGINT